MNFSNPVFNLSTLIQPLCVAGYEAIQAMIRVYGINVEEKYLAPILSWAFVYRVFSILVLIIAPVLIGLASPGDPPAKFGLMTNSFLDNT